MFRALLAHPHEVLHKRDLVYCVRAMSVCCYQYWSGTGVGDTMLMYYDARSTKLQERYQGSNLWLWKFDGLGSFLLVACGTNSIETVTNEYLNCSHNFNANYSRRVKEGLTKCIFQNDHIFRISSCSYMFRRIRSAILREPNVILMKLYVYYITQL
jgi:hypothetical protein